MSIDRIPPPRTDTVVVQSAPRPTPTPVRVSFKQVVAAGASGLARGAELAMRVIPGSPMTAAATRGGPGVTMAGNVGVGAGTRVAEGPGGVGVGGVGGVGVGAGGIGVSAGGVGVGTASENPGGLEASLAQAQEMNLYYLQIQEQVNAQNRVFSTLSNVLKAEHDTVKTAIGNIR